VSDIKQSLNDELDDQEGTKLLKQMKDDKTKFLKKFAIKGVTQQDFDKAIKGDSIPSVVQLPARKRDAEDDSEDLEKSVKPDKKSKKNKKQKSN